MGMSSKLTIFLMVGSSIFISSVHAVVLGTRVTQVMGSLDSGSGSDSDGSESSSSSRSSSSLSDRVASPQFHEHVEVGAASHFPPVFDFASQFAIFEFASQLAKQYEIIINRKQFESLNNQQKERVEKGEPSKTYGDYIKALELKTSAEDLELAFMDIKNHEDEVIQVVKVYEDTDFTPMELEQTCELLQSGPSKTDYSVSVKEEEEVKTAPNVSMTLSKKLQQIQEDIAMRNQESLASRTKAEEDITYRLDSITKADMTPEQLADLKKRTQQAMSDLVQTVAPDRVFEDLHEDCESISDKGKACMCNVPGKLLKVVDDKGACDTLKGHKDCDDVDDGVKETEKCFCEIQESGEHFWEVLTKEKCDTRIFKDAVAEPDTFILEKENNSLNFGKDMAFKKENYGEKPEAEDSLNLSNLFQHGANGISQIVIYPEEGNSDAGDLELADLLGEGSHEDSPKKAELS